VLYLSAVPFAQIGLRTNVPLEPLPSLTWRGLELVPDVISTGSVLLGGIWWIINRREEVARAEGKRNELTAAENHDLARHLCGHPAQRIVCHLAAHLRWVGRVDQPQRPGSPGVSGSLSTFFAE
jgi:hypothetical protein